MNRSGEIINKRYRIEDVLGFGGVGITYKGIDLKFDRVVAIKAVSLKQLRDWKQIELFEREAEVLSLLDNPNIPKYLDYFALETDKDKVFYIVQELAPGKSLFELVENGWRTTETEVKQIAEQILSILDYLHSQKPPVIHRDIKPQNLIRSDNGKIFLVDFGAVQNTYYDTLMRGSTVVGTYGYMAPEQFRGKALPATYLYSLGATLLYLLTHRSPSELPENALKIDFKSYVNISDSFIEWLDKILEPDPQDRFSSAKKALLVLRSNKQVIKVKKQFITVVKKLKERLILSFSIAIPIAGGILFNLHEHNILMRSNTYRKKLCSEPKLIRKYLEEDRDININFKINGKSQDFLDCLVNKTDYELIELLHSKKSIIKNREKYKLIMMVYYIDRNNLQGVEDLIKQNIDLNIKYQRHIRDESIKNITEETNYVTYYFCTRSTILNEAIIRKNLQVVKLLIKNGSNINDECLVRNYKKHNLYKLDKVLTPLSLAIRLNNTEIVKFLLDKGANLDSKKFILTLSNAISRDYYDLLKILLKYGLDPKENNDFIVERIYTYQPNPKAQPNRFEREIKFDKYSSLLDFAKAKKKNKIIDLFSEYTDINNE